jgi:hypothetical protein
MLRRNLHGQFPVRRSPTRVMCAPSAFSRSSILS